MEVKKVTEFEKRFQGELDAHRYHDPDIYVSDIYVPDISEKQRRFAEAYWARRNRMNYIQRRVKHMMCTLRSKRRMMAFFAWLGEKLCNAVRR